MPILQLRQVGYEPGGHSVLKALDWKLEPDDRIGLVGANGSGKSSLLHVLAGRIEPERGEVERARALRVGLLPQDVAFPDGRSVAQVASVPPPALAAVEAELARIERQLADPAVQHDPDRLARVLARHEDALHRHDALGGTLHQSRVRAALAQLGFGKEDLDRPAASLSGGRKKLAALAALVAESPDLLLLDEPDNHLDLEAREALQAFLADYPGAFVVVSHDRYLLDACVRAIAELEDGRLTLHPGGYSDWATERERRRLHQQRAWTAQQREIARVEASIRRFEEWAHRVVNERHAKQARSRRRALERMEERGERVARVRERRRMRLELHGGRGSEKALELAGVAMAFGDQRLFARVDLLVRHGERVGVVGPNGCGKSVLLGLARGALEPRGGVVRVGAGNRVGYYAQEHETLARWLARTPLARVQHVRPMTEGEAVAFLRRFGFEADQAQAPIAGLSGGERSKLQLGCLMLEQPNLLLLDEPTNNLDIPSAEVLEAALEDFEGALVVVSHDRWFLDRVVDRVVELGPDGLTDYAGGYSEYVEARRSA